MSTLLSIATLLVAAAAAADVKTLTLSGKCDRNCETCAAAQEYNATGECNLLGQTSYKATCANETYVLRKYTDAACKEGEQVTTGKNTCEPQLYRSGKITIDNEKKSITLALCDEGTDDKCPSATGCKELTMPTNNDTCQQPTAGDDKDKYWYKGSTTTDGKASLSVYTKEDCSGDAIYSVKNAEAGCYSTMQYAKAECVTPTTTTSTSVGMLSVVGAVVAVCVTMFVL